MAKLEKKAKEDHSNDWLSTYGDMVTLLLCFFVMMLSAAADVLRSALCFVITGRTEVPVHISGVYVPRQIPE